MDTDDLSTETYRAVLLTAERFNHNLTLEFALLADECDNDDDYLAEALKLIQLFKSDVDESLDEIFFDCPSPSASSFLDVLGEIERNIEAVKTIPVKKRHFEF